MENAPQNNPVLDFEKWKPQISKEFDQLIALLPNPDDPKKEEFPMAASVVRITADGKLELLARCTNQVRKNKDSTDHAELVALKEAQKKLGTRHLDEVILLSTAQPCEMCAGAVRNTRVGTVIYAITQSELEGTHVQFGNEYKKIRTVPRDFDIDKLLQSSGINVIAGYKHDEVKKKMTRFVGTFKELYNDPDAKL